MTPTETVSRLRRLADDWHKEEKQLCDQFGNEIIPRSMRARRIKDTKAIDAAIEMIERLEAAESDALEQARMNGMGSEREAALMAKLEAAENEVAHIKEVEFPRKVRAVAVGWETKCARLEQERDNANAAAAGIALQAETLQAERDELLARIDKLNVQNSAMLKALFAIADWNSAWGPFPEKNEHWRAMAIVTAREATKAFEQGEQK